MRELQITSVAFQEGDEIPIKYSCDGNDTSPALSWDGVPPETRSLTLICEDPDAPSGLFTHWLLYNIPPGTTKLAEDLPITEKLANGSLQGRNSFKNIGYGGPCPPPKDNAHRYFFRLYALDTELDLPGGANREEVLRAIDGHILAEGQLMGKYQRTQMQTRRA